MACASREMVCYYATPVQYNLCQLEVMELFVAKGAKLILIFHFR